MAKQARTERLLALSLLLLNREVPVTRSDIREMVKDYPSDASDEAFGKMFERDKDELRSLGFPIETIGSDDQEGIAYVLDSSDVTLDPIEFTAEEKVALNLASRYWAGSVNQSNATHALRKLETVTDLSGVARSSMPLTHVSQDAKVDLDLVRVVDAAVAQGRAVSVRYRKPGDLDPKQRLVSPWGIVLHSGTSYLVGFDHDREAVRTFKLARIVGAPKMVGGTEYRGAGDQDPKEVFATAVAQLSKSQDHQAEVSKALLANGGKGPQPWDHDPSLAKDVRTVLTAAQAGQKSAQSDLADGKFSDGLAQLDKARKAAARKPTGDSSTQFTRILAIVPWLVQHPGVATSEAAKEFGISEEQLVKDLNLAYCTEFGFDNITMDFYIHSTLQVLDPQGIDRPLKFTANEAFALQLGLLQLQQLQGIADLDAIVSAGQKLAVATGVEPQAVHVNSLASADVAEFRQTIESAIDESAVLQLTYQGTLDAEPTVRLVEPYRVSSVDNQSYLVAWSQEAEGVRYFRFDRIKALAATGESFDRSEQPPFEVDSRPLANVSEFAVLRVDSSKAWWVESIVDAVYVNESDRTLLVSIPLGSADWLMKTVAGFGGEVQILEPASLVDNYRDYLDRTNRG